MLQSKSVFKYFYQFAKPYRLALFSVFLFFTARILFSNILSGYIYKNLIDNLNLASVSKGARYEVAIALVVSLGVAFTTAMVMGRYSEWTMFRFLARALEDIYNFCFKKLLLHSQGFYNSSFTGSIVAKTKRFVKSFDMMTGILIYNFWGTMVVIVGSSVALYFQSKKLALYFVLWCLIYFFFITFFVKRKIKIDIARAEADSKITGVLSDSITNISNIKSFSTSQKEFNYFKEVVGFFKKRVFGAWRFTTQRHLFQALAMSIFHIFVLYTMVNMWLAGEITVGVFIMVYVYFTNIVDRIWDLSSGLTNFMEALTDAHEMVNILETPIEVKDPERPEIPKIKEGNIEFRNVSFKYKGGADVLENFNLKIAKGEKVGLVGHSGSGKSTLTKLVLRFVDPDAGQVLIDGQHIAKITQDALRQSIAYVPQESILFHRTIKENIGYAKEGATEEEIVDAAKLAHAHEFIEKMKEGYDTMVGERGVKLSGGERQRVSIARAMLKQAPILILDEATSSLDSISESYIQEAFEKLMQGKTTIVIAHRLSTIQKMDRIIVLDQGKIVEEGAHSDLLAKGGFYASLWSHQTGSFLD